ncbi:MAG: monomeric [FeFe] hydrogenase [Pleomorphochaeta sp.]
MNNYGVKRIFERMRGIYTPVTDIRRRLLMEVARFILDDKSPKDIEELPYNIIEMGKPQYRCCSYRELSITKQRIRLAFGLPLIEEKEHVPISSGIEKAFTSKKIIDTPLVNVIHAACEKCPEDLVIVTDRCQSCMAHPCSIVCPRDAISFPDGKAVIDQDKCIKCMKCVQACPYSVITRMVRPCAEACGVNAIDSDEEGFARINQDTCVSCGLCIVSCPFAAISDKSEIVQLIHSLQERKNGKTRKLYAIVAPAFIGQFGNKITPEAIFEGISKLGFDKVMEVAYGADFDTVILAKKYMEKEKGFLGTSCCPSWVMAAHNAYPDLAENISDSYTPMVETARKIRENDMNAKVVFIGPCVAKKHEALTSDVARYIDHVITFEELAALFVAYNIDLNSLKGEIPINDASPLGRGYANAGGVANAIIQAAEEKFDIKDISFNKADTLRDCLSMLKSIQKGEYTPDLVEGMACPGGCIGGPGTMASPRQVARLVTKFAESSKVKLPQIESND